MTEGELDHLSDLGHLLPASTDIIIANLLSGLLILTLNRLTFVEDQSLVADDAPLWGVDIDNLEFDRLSSELGGEAVSLSYGTVSLLEVGYQDILSDVATDSLDGVGEGQDVDLNSVGDIRKRLDLAVVSHAAADVLSNTLVSSDFAVGLLGVLRGDDSADGLSSLLSLEANSLTIEDLQFVHLSGGELAEGVVIHVLRDLLHGELVGTLPVVEDSGR